MRLTVYFRVLWRFRIVVGIGLVVALALTFLTVARVDFTTGKISYRSSEQWTSYARIFVTQPGFPYGEVNSKSDPTLLASKALLYSQLASSDRVLHLAFGSHKPPGTIQAAPVLASASSNDALPIISIAATESTQYGAINVATRETNALIRYVESRQQAASIPDENRVALQVIANPNTAVLVKGRSKTLASVVFVAVMLGVIVLAFVLENMRPSVLPNERAAAVPLSRSSVA